MRTMRDITEITRANIEDLLAVAKQRIDSFKILKEIYDDAFLYRVVQRKKDYDNDLLLFLVIDNPVAVRFFQEVEENLKTLQANCLQKFSKKLRQYTTRAFESVITEIEFAADFTRKGFQIELEPALPNGRTADFCASKGSLRIFFEVKNIFPQRSHEEKLIILELEDRYSRLDTPFVISFDLKKNFPRNKISDVIKFVERRLKKHDGDALPQSFCYPESGEPIIKFNVRKRLPTGEKGYIGGGVHGGGIKGDWSDLRNNISSGVSQLHPDHPGVLIVQTYGLSTMRYDIENALLGDLKINLFGELRPFRQGDSILFKDRNKRLSAVIYCEKRLQGSAYVRKKIVYHNFNPKAKLSPEIFKGENIIQFLPTKLDNGKIRLEQIGILDDLL